MSTKRKGVPPPRAIDRRNLTLLDELAASPTDPMPVGDADRRVWLVRENFEQLVYGTDPHRVNWVVIGAANNLLEVMRELDMIDDPDSVLHDAYLTLRSVSLHANEHGVPPRLVGAEITAIGTMVEAFTLALGGVPHRSVVRAMRELEKRMRRLKQRDYDGNLLKHRRQDE